MAELQFKSCHVCGLRIGEARRDGVKLIYSFTNQVWTCENCKDIKLKKKLRKSLTLKGENKWKK